MGGNAIKDCRRISLEEHNSICVELCKLFYNLHMVPLRAYRSKQDFGDIDFIVELIPNFDIKAYVKEKLQLYKDDYYDNGPVLSFRYKDVQIDFNFFSKDEFESAYEFNGCGDIGNLLGRVARSINFKYGHDLLSYECHLNDHYKLSINISKDIKKVLEFLGYDYEIYIKGFDTPEDIYAFIVSSPLFNAQYFSLENQSHDHRVRNKKRKMYRGMIEYIEQQGYQPKPKLTQEERMFHYNRAIEMFGNEFDLKVQKALADYKKDLEFKKYYNGEMVYKITGLTGKELGNFMQKFKSYTDWDNFKNFVLSGKDDYSRHTNAYIKVISFHFNYFNYKLNEQL